MTFRRRHASQACVAAARLPMGIVRSRSVGRRGCGGYRTPCRAASSWPLPRPLTTPWDVASQNIILTSSVGMGMAETEDARGRVRRRLVLSPRGNYGTVRNPETYVPRFNLTYKYVLRKYRSCVSQACYFAKCGLSRQMSARIHPNTVGKAFWKYGASPCQVRK